MAFPLLQTALFAALEALLNRAISLDPPAHHRLEALEGRCLAIHCTAPALSVYLSVDGKGLRLTGQREDEADASLSGGTQALLQLLLAQDKALALRNDELRISGDLALMQQFQDILAGLNIDWEFYLARGIGDVPTQALSDALHQGRDFVKRSAHSLSLDLDEYLHEEGRMLPAAAELQGFYDSVDELRLRLDRLGARIERITHAFTDAENRPAPRAPE
ncbi:MAG: SCP2 sterol-binding domain-containing protein [Pseudomonadales bacterium]|nr:SCP2 sterol-binding domain-containing protein [Pseudomonadales bacterium]